MDLRYFNLRELKEKFAKLVAFMFSGLGLSLPALSEIIVENPYFDFLERNETNHFLENGYEKILHEIFGMDIPFDFDAPLHSEAYWIGYQTINISISTATPLKRVVLQMPLEEMIGFYPEFHERNDADFAQYFAQNFANRSVLKKAIDGMTVAEVSLLSGIKRPTLVQLLQNEKLFRASAQSIDSLISVLGVSPSIFRERSSFIPFDPLYFQIDEFRSRFVMKLPLIMGMRGISSINIGCANVDFGSWDQPILFFLPYEEPDINEVKILVRGRKAVITSTNGLTLYKRQNGKFISEVLDQKYYWLFRLVASQVPLQ